MAEAASLVVLIQPHDATREKISDQLRRAGYEVRAISTPLEAYDVVAARPHTVLQAKSTGPASLNPDDGPGGSIELIRTAFDHFGDAMGLLDQGGHLVLANPGMELLIRGNNQSLPNWIRAHQGNPTDWPFLRAARTGRREADEWTGGRRRYRLTADPLTDQDGSFAGAVVVVSVVGPARILVDGSSPSFEEDRSAEDRIAQLEQDVRLIQQFSAPRPDDDSPSAHGHSTSLRKSDLPAFRIVIERYERIMEQVVEERAYRVDHQTSESLRRLGELLGTLGAGPRDVVEIHSMALRRKCSGGASIKANAYTAEGRLMVLELMGNLVAYYRSNSIHAARGQHAGDPADRADHG